MKKWTKILTSVVCAAVMFFGSGCGSSNKMDEIFQGNYVETSEETAKNFLANIKGAGKNELETLAKNNGGVNVAMKGKFIGISIMQAEGKVLWNTDGSYQYKFEMDGIYTKIAHEPPSIYCDGKYCYTQEEGVKTMHTYSNGCLDSCLSFLNYMVGYNSLTELERGLDEGKMELIDRQYFMDSKDSNFTKVKRIIKVKMQDSTDVSNLVRGSELTLESISVYDKNNNLTAQHDVMELWWGKLTSSYTPWSGTITPPNDLDSYMFENK